MVKYESNSNRVSGWKPLFVREIRERAEAAGILQATHDILVRDNVTVNASGHTDEIEAHQHGMLFVGNHNKQFEFVALMDYLSQIGRTTMKNIVKFYVEDQVASALGEVGTDIVLPVYPRLLTTDRPTLKKMNLELPSRVKYHRLLRDSEGAQRMNDESLQAAADELAEDGVVNIFPCGSIRNNMRLPWREGVGRIVTRLPPEDRSDVLVVPYHADSINRFRMLAAVACRGRGPFGSPQQVDLAFGQPITAANVVEMLPEHRQDDPAMITDVLRQQYTTSFAAEAT